MSLKSAAAKVMDYKAWCNYYFFIFFKALFQHLVFSDSNVPESSYNLLGPIEFKTVLFILCDQIYTMDNGLTSTKNLIALSQPDKFTTTILSLFNQNSF